MARRQVSAGAERTLDAWLAGLMEGKIHIQDLPLCVAAWFHAGEAYGRAARQLEIDHANHQADLFYMQAMTPKERQQEYQRRLENHFQRENDLFFADPVDTGTPPDLEGAADGHTPERSPHSGARDPRPIHRPDLAA
ncbi:MAG: hypothetical protein D3X82_08000 [Candidatus Leucobacter sulfamidivorax]|nr:hypothetical protein [Candidatus Leucobacter sulfamidivorax]